MVVDLINEDSERIEDWQHQNTGDDRIQSEPLIDDIGDVRAENDKRRMRDIDDVQNAEGDRDSDRHRNIEAAEQQSGDYGVKQKIETHGAANPAAPLAFMGARELQHKHRSG